MLPCQDTILPTSGSIANAFNDLTLPEIDAMSAINKIWPMSASDPFFETIDIPEIEWEKRATYLIQEYHGFVMTKMLEIIKSVIPVDLIEIGRAHV